MEIIQREALAAFLRSRREATPPEMVGFSGQGRRRTPGLRREELAQLGGVSLTWYTWLEQAREIGVGRPVIERLSQGLRLTPAERAHLFTLAGLSLPPEPVPRPEVDATLRRLVDTLSPHPAYVINPWWDLLAYNDAFAALVGGLEQRPVSERNNLWLLFADEGVKGLFIDWPAEVRPLLGQLRAHLAQYPADPRGPELVDLLSRTNPKFEGLWREHHVRRFETAGKRVLHPRVGPLRFDYVKLATANEFRQSLVVYLPADADTARRLPDLAAGP